VTCKLAKRYFTLVRNIRMIAAKPFNTVSRTFHIVQSVSVNWVKQRTDSEAKIHLRLKGTWPHAE
jgi:hypothetical protein